MPSGVVEVKALSYRASVVVEQKAVITYVSVHVSARHDMERPDQ